ncbi:MAG: hypothetical protein NXI31_00065 [bacterium]|nr:hypothetical protein [bacterium]
MNESESPSPADRPETAPASPPVPATADSPPESPPAAAPDSSAGGESPAGSNPPPESAGAAPQDGQAGDDAGGDKPARKRRRRRRKPRAGDSASPEAGAGTAGETPAGTGGEAAEFAAAPAEGDGTPGGGRGKRRRRGRSGSGAAAGSGGNPNPRKGGGRGPGAGGSGQRDTAHLATQAVRALSEMAQQLLRVEGVDPLAMPRYLDLELRVPLESGRGGKDLRQAAGTAVDQILKRVREVREHERALRPGAVFSYFAGSSEADGCRPTEPRHVFEGYSSTGKPEFVDFVTMAIDRKDAGIDRLLAGEDVILTQVTMGRVLRTQQLAEFGGESPVYKILGQVNAGLFRTLGAAGKCAFSFQLLRGTTLEGRVRLRLHPVGAVDMFELVDPAIMQILSRFQRRLDTEALRLEGRLKNGETDEEEFVLPLLNDLAKQLQHRTRNAGRRTQHGLERSEEGQRPTSRAYPDAGEAADDAILWDLDQGTIVVLGAKGRVHVFTPDAKHVTSVVMQRSAVDRRRQLGRWRAADPEERGEFRIQVRRQIRAEAERAEVDAAAAASGPAVDAPADSKPAAADAAPEPSTTVTPPSAAVPDAAVPDAAVPDGAAPDAPSTDASADGTSADPEGKDA